MGDNQILDSGYPKDNHISASVGPTEKYDLSNYIRISFPGLFKGIHKRLESYKEEQ